MHLRIRFSGSESDRNGFKSPPPPSPFSRSEVPKAGIRSSLRRSERAIAEFNRDRCRGSSRTQRHACFQVFCTHAHYTVLLPFHCAVAANLSACCNLCVLFFIAFALSVLTYLCKVFSTVTLASCKFLRVPFSPRSQPSLFLLFCFVFLLFCVTRPLVCPVWVKVIANPDQNPDPPVG